MSTRPINLRCAVYEALKDHAKNAVPGVKDDTLIDLFRQVPGSPGSTLIDIATVFPEPRLHYSRQYEELPPPRSAGQFADRFDKATCRALRGFDLAGAGYVAAGSSVLVPAIFGRIDGHCTVNPGDTDLFIVGLSQDEAEVSVRRLAQHLLGWAATKGRDYSVLYQCTGRADTFHICRGCAPLQDHISTVQVVRRLYSSIAEVLYGFDLGASSIAWDGRQLLTTKLGYLALTSRVNVVNLRSRRPSYERRLAKYFRKYEMGIVYPCLENLETRSWRFPGWFHIVLQVDAFSSYQIEDELGGKRTTYAVSLGHNECASGTGQGWEVPEEYTARADHEARRTALSAAKAIASGKLPAASTATKFDSVEEWEAISQFVSLDQLCETVGRHTPAGDVAALGDYAGRILEAIALDGSAATVAVAGVLSELLAERPELNQIRRDYCGVTKDTLLGSEQTDPREWYGPWYSESEARRLEAAIVD